MKKNVLKSAFAITCVVAASVSSFKAYDQHDKNVAAANMLLAENVEALSVGDSWASWASAAGSFVAGLFSGGGNSNQEKWYRAQCNEPCTLWKKINGRDQQIDGARKGCEDTKAETAGCTIPNYNPCRE